MGRLGRVTAILNRTFGFWRWRKRRHASKQVTYVLPPAEYAERTVETSDERSTNAPSDDEAVDPLDAVLRDVTSKNNVNAATPKDADEEHRPKLFRSSRVRTSMLSEEVDELYDVLKETAFRANGDLEQTTTRHIGRTHDRVFKGQDEVAGYCSRRRWHRLRGRPPHILAGEERRCPICSRLFCPTCTLPLTHPIGRSLVYYCYRDWMLVACWRATKFIAKACFWICAGTITVTLLILNMFLDSRSFEQHREEQRRKKYERQVREQMATQRHESQHPVMWQERNQFPRRTDRRG